MRNKTPIQQQRTTQTQLSRGRPHNPSLARRNQPPRQRKSPLRQMQQQTRKRQTRQRQSTPLPEKRRRKRQTTRSSNANTTQRHMVNHPPPFQTIERRGVESEEQSRQDKANNKEDAMVFGDNVRARIAARALPRTPQQRGREKKRKRKKKRKRNNETITSTPPPFHNPHTTLRRTPQHVKGQR